MNKIILTLFLFDFAHAFSQSSIELKNMATAATVAPNTFITAATFANGTTQHSIDIKNTSASTKTIIIKRYDILLFSTITSTAFAVFNNMAANAHTLSFQLTAGQSASQIAGTNYFVSEFFEADAVGHSIVKYTFFNTSMLSDSSQITLDFNPVTGLLKLASNFSSAELFPNPVNEKGNIIISSQISCAGKFIIYNLHGAIISEKLISIDRGKNKIEFSTESMYSGIYFASLQFGTVTIIKKFAVN